MWPSLTFVVLTSWKICDLIFLIFIYSFLKLQINKKSILKKNTKEPYMTFNVKLYIVKNVSLLGYHSYNSIFYQNKFLNECARKKKR